MDLLTFLHVLKYSPGIARRFSDKKRKAHHKRTLWLQLVVLMCSHCQRLISEHRNQKTPMTKLPEMSDYNLCKSIATTLQCNVTRLDVRKWTEKYAYNFS